MIEQPGHDLESVKSEGRSFPGPSPKKSGRVVLIGVGLLVLVLLCCGACFLTFGASIYKSVTERPAIESVIDAFMVAMSSRDIDAAFALFTPRDNNDFLRRDLQFMLEGNNFVLFDGYRRITITNLQIGRAVNTNPDMPQGTYAEVEGTVTYDDGIPGTFTATLEQRGSVWTLHHINIVVPPAKLGP